MDFDTHDISYILTETYPDFVVSLSVCHDFVVSPSVCHDFVVSLCPHHLKSHYCWLDKIYCV